MSQTATIVPPKVLWQHPHPETTYLERFRHYVNRRHNLSLQTYDDIHEYSTSRYADFWDDVFHYSDIIYTGVYNKVVDTSAPMHSIPKWFDGVRLNLAENILYGPGRDPNKLAVTSIREGNTDVRSVTWDELRTLVARYASAFRNAGVNPGDRVAIVASNTLNTMLVFLAVTALGAIFTSTSTDMGTKGILDRLLQVRPRIVLMEDLAVYAGKKTNLKQKAIEVANALKGTPEFEKFIVCPRGADVGDISQISKSQSLVTFLATARPITREKLFFQHAFDTPYLIAYSSGTTGQPKCIVHGAGGVLISQKKELLLHYNIGPSSTQMIFTTTSWAMYNKSITSLLTGAHIITYDGSPFHTAPTVLLEIAAQHKVTHLGISPRYLEELERRGVEPKKQFDLSALEMVNCTGAALLPQQYAWFYGTAFGAHVQLANSAGGTDTACCFAAQVPTLPVYAGELQRPALAMDIGVFEPSSSSTNSSGIPSGVPVPRGQPGELVVCKSFPSMPVMFWGDGGAERYHSAYFSQLADVWTQGDYIRIVASTGGVEFLGRSDGVLNPSGVRFGSAEIYSVVQHFPAILDSICVGQRRPRDSDERVFLFVQMRSGAKFTVELEAEIRAAIRKALSARHVPKYIFECPELPMTINGKKVEVPVKAIISEKRVVASATLANAGCLGFFERFARVEELMGEEGRARL
ncbi:hypothetical protein VE01_09429 [Pseudogymnoascus verrucosus]|uniref:AMP-dependent synthetase/ligase domain-containing protein n=1 Tax=Pseudogymnoascus verrucosus TaxID=342668 RepID=A0A1B8G945_9PEZI|nr:uncharacterized protein VE01_09429 [Pseudogymnoascus verrucosus]OBT92358.1 hypothetical protein VE01_09429 [Pseudogymnoascus verrucosus]